VRLTRRTLLFRTSAGAAAIGALAAAPALLGPRASAGAAERPIAPAPTTARAADHSAAGPIVAHVRDAGRGEIAIYVGTREVVIYDPGLVARLIQNL
jgi:hypothetical protein